VSRIEWTRLQGDDVEAVVAMLVNRERPNSIRISPSRGDGGIDILERGGATDGRDAVYQVKRYSGPLNKKQKGEVESSLKTLTEDPRWKGLNVSEWYLVTPWDPTPEAEKWLQDLAGAQGFRGIWRGLTWADQQAAKYPEVADYYLNGGLGRIQEAYAAVMAYATLDKTGEFPDVTAIAERIEAALPLLDTDPLYRYELRFGEGDMPSEVSRAGIVMTQIIGHGEGGKWTAIDLIARCAASTQIRPITISGTFVAKSGSPFEKDLRDFFDFGAPFKSPPGVYSGEIDAPGGLGGEIANATVWTLPVDEDLGPNTELLVEIIDPEGVTIASAEVTRVERSFGAKGKRVVLEEVNGAFTVENRTLMDEKVSTRTMTLGALAGQPVQVVARALEFLLACVSPNTGRLSLRHTPPARGVPDPAWTFLDQLPEVVKSLKREKIAVDALLTIQGEVASPIIVPDLGEVPVLEVREWVAIARLITDGETVASYPEGQQLILEVDEESELPGDPIGVTMPISVTIAGARLDLGSAEVWLDKPTIHSRTVRDGHAYYGITTPDRSYRWRRSTHGPRASPPSNSS
jgi:hypothetical protein